MKTIVFNIDNESFSWTMSGKDLYKIVYETINEVAKGSKIYDRKNFCKLSTSSRGGSSKMVY